MLKRQFKIAGWAAVKVKGSVKGKPTGFSEAGNVITIVKGAAAWEINRNGNCNGNVEVSTPFETSIE